MTNIVIKVDNVSKLYRLGQVGRGTIKHDVNRWLHRVLGKNDPYHLVGEENDRSRRGDSEYVWALKDISFDVKQGEVLGIIGKNGAGKSTLLKILSKVTAPTTGTIKSKGKIASLLEVGTGFHPDLTGRDNIFLNGAILGMKKKEIQRKFDEIVDFSGVERYIDTPVKRYSSGMYVRLAFSVAAHLDPEILIVDEVLAVGDAEFQKKCMGKMKDVSDRHGRTVLFVSHNMNAVLRLCENVLLLEQGKIYASGPSNSVINQYLNREVENNIYKSWQGDDGPGNMHVRLKELKITDNEGLLTDVYDIRKPVLVHMTYKVFSDNMPLTHAFVFHDEKGHRLFDSHDVNSAWKSNTRRSKGMYSATLEIPGNFFAEGKIKVSPAVITSDPFEIHFYEEDMLAFMIVDISQGDSARGAFAGNYPGLVRPLFNWVSQYTQI